MTEDTLNKGESALIAVKNLTALSNELAGVASTVYSGNAQVPGLDPLIAQAFRYGAISVKDLAPFIDQLTEAVKVKQDEMQKTFDAL